MPHLVQFHDADRFNPARLWTKALNVVAKALNPTHDGRMRDTCQTGNAAKPDTFEVKTNTVYPCFNRCAAQAKRVRYNYNRNLCIYSAVYL